MKAFPRTLYTEFLTSAHCLGLGTRTGRKRVEPEAFLRLLSGIAPHGAS